MAKVVDEKFETPGYEEVWTETVVAGSLTDDHTVAAAGSPAGWDSYCLEVVANAQNCYTHRALASGLAISYVRIEVVLTSESFANTNRSDILTAWSTAWGLVYGLTFIQTADVIYLQLNSKHNGSDNLYRSLAAVSLNIPYRVEIKWDGTNDVWAWRINGVDQPNEVDSTDPVASEGALSSTHQTDVKQLRIGPSSLKTACTWYCDNFAVDNAAWVGAEQLKYTSAPVGSATSSGESTRLLQATRAYSGATTPEGSIQRTIQALRTYDSALTLSGDVSRTIEVASASSGELSSAGSVSRLVEGNRTNDGAFSFAGEVTGIKSVEQITSGEIAFSGTVTNDYVAPIVIPVEVTPSVPKWIQLERVGNDERDIQDILYILGNVLRG